LIDKRSRGEFCAKTALAKSSTVVITMARYWEKLIWVDIISSIP